MNYYISDMHFGHSNVIGFDNRPFKDIIEMDEKMIRWWNQTVKKADDTVYIIGDMSWYKPDKTLDILRELNGKHVLIKGNHDRISQQINGHFKGNIHDYLEIVEQGRRVVMCHYPIISWNFQFRDSVHLYGHIHNTNQHVVMEHFKKELECFQGFPTLAFNVGCMMPYMNYRPRTLDEILEGGKF